MTVAVLPSPDVYDLEYAYWPWGQLVTLVANRVADTAPNGGYVFDYMCGTGYLLAEIATRRPDLRLEGCDINAQFVEYANLRYPQLGIHNADALVFFPKSKPNVILCTAGLHHLQPADQDTFIQHLRQAVPVDGFLFVGEEVIRDFSTEQERLLAALRLDADLLELALLQEWPTSMLEAVIEVMKNDILKRGEYKQSERIWASKLSRCFTVETTEYTWSISSGGDCLFVCSAGAPI